MNACHITEMAALEREHWWYCSLRDLIARTLAAPKWRLPARPRVLDAGCGTGANLELLADRLRPAYLGGFDRSPVALQQSRDKAPGADLYASDLREPQFHVDALDLILSCDALSIAGIQPCRPGLKRLIGRLDPGGLFILHLPAFAWLHSAHDRAIGTRDRVTVPQVISLLRGLGLEVELATYRLCLLFPALLGTRLPTLVGKRRGEARSDLRATSMRLNAALQAVCRVENEAICRGIAFPFGSSVYAVGRKR